jgi:hypothetical protein
MARIASPDTSVVLTALVGLAVSASPVRAQPVVYLVRHAEPTLPAMASGANRHLTLADALGLKEWKPTTPAHHRSWSNTSSTRRVGSWWRHIATRRPSSFPC